MPESLFTVSVVARGLADLTERCLLSVLAGPCEGVDVVLSDNSDSEADAAAIEAMFLRLLMTGCGGASMRMVRHGANVGYVHAQNRAFTLAPSAPFFVCLNNDAVVPQDWLGRMLAAMDRDPKVALVGVKGTISELGHDGTGCGNAKAEYVEGSCMMVRRGHVPPPLFDPAYGIGYFEDSDLSLRLRSHGLAIAHVDLPGFRHERAATAAAVERDGTVDLEGLRIRNAQIFRSRWSRYLERRTFDAPLLVRRRAARGDVLLATPVLRALARARPQRRIVVETAFPDLLRGNPYATATSEPQDPARYDEFYDLDLAYERRPLVHVVDAYYAACGIEGPQGQDGRYATDIFPDDADRAAARELVPDGPQTIAIHADRTSWAGRDWPAARWGDLAGLLYARGFRVAWVGGANAPPVKLPIAQRRARPIRKRPSVWSPSPPPPPPPPSGGADLDLRGRTTAHVLAEALRRCAGFVGPDSFPMHLALWAGIPTAAVFGMIDPDLRLPPRIPGSRRGTTVREVVDGWTACRGCHHREPAPRTCGGCPRGTPVCMERIRPEAVVEALLGAIYASRELEAGTVAAEPVGTVAGR